jgi:hypothetical protein
MRVPNGGRGCAWEIPASAPGILPENALNDYGEDETEQSGK